MKTLYRGLYVLVVGLHYGVFFAFVITSLVGILLFPWYVYLTIVSLIARVLVSREICPLTVVEDYIGAKIGYAKSKGFLKDWILRPIKAIL